MSDNSEVSSDEDRSFDDDVEYSYDEESSEEEEALSEEDHRLLAAVAREDTAAAAAVQQAIRAGANVNAVRHRSTPLIQACEHGFDEIVGILLDSGADARLKDRDGSSAITEACYHGHLSTVQLLVNHDNGLLETTNNDGWTPLFFAVRQRRSDILRFLLERGADPHCVDQFGGTALMHACQRNDLEIVRLLLAAGVDVEARDKWQQTALHNAAEGGTTEIMRELVLQYNANMFAVDEDGCTPFDLACRSEQTDHLLEMYSNKLTQDHGRLALHELLKLAQYSFVEDHGFHTPLNPLRIVLPLGKLTLEHLHTLLHTLDPELVRTRDDTGKLPIHIACQTNAPVEVLALILELDPTTLHIADSTGALPIDLLCGSTAGTEYASVRYLIQSFPGSVAVQTNAGQYPFMMAAAAESSSASLSVIYELVRANPGLVVPRYV